MIVQGLQRALPPQTIVTGHGVEAAWTRRAPRPRPFGPRVVVAEAPKSGGTSIVTQTFPAHLRNIFTGGRRGINLIVIGRYLHRYIETPVARSYPPNAFEHRSRDMAWGVRAVPRCCSRHSGQMGRCSGRR